MKTKNKYLTRVPVSSLLQHLGEACHCVCTEDMFTCMSGLDCHEAQVFTGFKNTSTCDFKTQTFPASQERQNRRDWGRSSGNIPKIQSRVGTFLLVWKMLSLSSFVIFSWFYDERQRCLQPYFMHIYVQKIELIKKNTI